MNHIFQIIAVTVLCQTSLGFVTDGEQLLRLIQRSFSTNLTWDGESASNSSTEAPSVTSAEISSQLDPSNFTEPPDQTTTAAPTTLPTTSRPKQNVSTSYINFTNEDITYFGDILRYDVAPEKRLEYFNALSDVMRQENKFQDDVYITEFAELFYWVLSVSNGSNLTGWSKKVERKNLKRFLKYALNSEALNPDKDGDNTGCAGEQPYVPYKWLSKPFYQSLLTHTETEGYEILLEVIEVRNVTLHIEQMKAIQCLYYGSYNGMANGDAYIFSAFDEEWDLRNSLFGKPLIRHSLKSIVSDLTGLSNQTPKVSKFMEEIFGVFSEYRNKLDEEVKTRPRKSERYFHDSAGKLEGKLMGMVKSDIFLDYDSKDIMMGTAVEVILDATGEKFDPEKTPIVFDPFNRLSWYYLQLFRPAGAQVLQKYEEMFSRIVTEKITTVYKARLFRRRFNSGFLHVRLLPTGPLILVGSETLQRLMVEAEPRDKADNQIKIKNFQQTLLFLRGLYSTDENVINELPQQVQFLTNAELSQNLKLMVKYSPTDNAEGPQFAEVGVKFSNDGMPTLDFRPFPHISSGSDAVFKNEWQFQLGYFRGFSETLSTPVIKANILLAGEIDGELSYSWREGMVYEKERRNSSGFWEIKLLPHGQSFQLIHHGRLEQFFSIVYNNEDEKFPVRLAATHYIPDLVPKSFIPAEFIVVPTAGDYD